MKFDTEKLKPWLDKFWDDPPTCMICKSKDWILYNESLVLAEDQLSSLASSSLVQVISFLCSDCGHIIWFSPIVLSADKPILTTQEILDIEFDSIDLGEVSIRHYFKKLLVMMWIDDNFSAKRPFGKSKWRHEICYALVKHNIIGGNVDRDSCSIGKWFDKAEADKIIVKLIASL